MQVYLDYQKCVIHNQPMLPVNPNSGLFENSKVAEEENTYESPIDGLTQNRLVEKVSLEVYGNPNPNTFHISSYKVSKALPLHLHCVQSSYGPNVLQLPLRQWGAGNVYLLVLSS